MLELSKKLKLGADTASSPNLAVHFSEEDLVAIGTWVWQGYEKDEQSRAPWMRRMQAAMDLALQVVEEKSFPWAGASNVAFPLVTISALQFHSRAYPALVSGTDVVKMRVIGEDPEGLQAARAERVSCHMSYQVLEEDDCWEAQHDRMLIVLPIIGCAFKKSYHSVQAGHNKSELVFPQDLVIDYFAKSVEDCNRKTHIIPLSRNEMREKMLDEVFVDYTEADWFKQNAAPLVLEQTEEKDNRTGIQPPPQSDESTPFTTLEQSCWLDLDGDGYAEPYTITIEAASKRVLRVVARWDSVDDVKRNKAGKITRIVAEEYYTKYGLIPSPDGSIYDMGFGVLLGPLNESVNSLVNQLIDAGTMATTAGGFLGRGAKIRGGSYSFSPLEWKRVDSTGDDLRKNIVPLDVREPSAVLFNLLTLLINYTERISGSTDMMVGENPGQNTPAETSRAMVEQGMKIYNASFKRIWRSMKEEFKKLYILNGKYLPLSASYGQGRKALREDYMGDPNRICPTADPSVVSDNARIQQAITIKQDALTTRGYDMDAVTRNMLKAMRVEGIETLFPGGNDLPPQESEKIQVEKLRLQAKQMELQFEQQRFVAEMQETIRSNNAQMVVWQAEAAKLLAEAEDVGATTQVTALQAMVKAKETENNALAQRVEAMLRGMELQLKSKELDIKDREVTVKANAPKSTSK